LRDPDVREQIVVARRVERIADHPRLARQVRAQPAEQAPGSVHPGQEPDIHPPLLPQLGALVDATVGAPSQPRRDYGGTSAYTLTSSGASGSSIGSVWFDIASDVAETSRTKTPMSSP